MSAIALRLEQTLAALHPAYASKLEQLVGDALELAMPRSADPSSFVDANGWPLGHFETYAGSFADEPLEASDDQMPEPSIEP